MVKMICVEHDWKIWYEFFDKFVFIILIYIGAKQRWIVFYGAGYPQFFQPSFALVFLMRSTYDLYFSIKPKFDGGQLISKQDFAWSWYFSQTCNLQAEFVYILSAQSRQTNSACTSLT